MNIAVIDADLIGKKRHRFPNLVCMKLSGYHKNMGDNVILKTDYEKLDSFDKVYIAKVFTDTKIPSTVLSLPNVEYGGTGFFYDKAVPLPSSIEHHKPDYWACFKMRHFRVTNFVHPTRTKSSNRTL